MDIKEAMIILVKMYKLISSGSDEAIGDAAIEAVRIIRRKRKIIEFLKQN